MGLEDGWIEEMGVHCQDEENVSAQWLGLVGEFLVRDFGMDFWGMEARR